MSPRAHEKGVEIAWAVSPGMPTILADEGRLRQILLNYAGNAVKFTEKGGVLLTASLADGRRMRFSVADTGPGVAPEARAKIFEAFVQTDASHRTQLGGAGLGLAIVARLARAMDGEAGVGGEVARAPTSGSRRPFEIAAPYSAGRAAGRQAVAVASPNAIVRIAAARQIEAAGGRAFVAATRLALKGAPADAVLLIDAALAGRAGR
jgi:signal transduction histidine kinase